MTKKPTRRLFLDDDPERASAFLARHPDAVWVQTVPDCVEKLAEAWDEVHLDHDLGGELFVDVRREDCGMEVVRWLTGEPRRHLRKARFVVHSHNMAAAFEMAYRLRGQGYRVEARPFGVEPPGEGPSGLADRARRSPWSRLRDLVRRARGLPPRIGAEAFEVESPDDIP